MLVREAADLIGPHEVRGKTLQISRLIVRLRRTVPTFRWVILRLWWIVLRLRRTVRRFRAVLRRSERMIPACRTSKRFRLALYHDVTSWFATLLRTCVFRKITSLNGNETGQTSRKLRFTPLTGVLRNRGGSVVLTRERRRLRRTSRHGIGCFWLLRQWFSHFRRADHRNIFRLTILRRGLGAVESRCVIFGRDGAAASLSLPSETAISMDLLFSTEALVAARAGPSFSGEGDRQRVLTSSAGLGVLPRPDHCFWLLRQWFSQLRPLSTAISTGFCSPGDLSAGESRFVHFGRGGATSFSLARPQPPYFAPDRLFSALPAVVIHSGALGTAISTGLLFSAGAFVPEKAGLWRGLATCSRSRLTLQLPHMDCAWLVAKWFSPLAAEHRNRGCRSAQGP